MVVVSTEVARLDLDTVHRWLSTDAYWAIGRPRDVLERSVAGSLNFGAYVDDRQVGYARVVTDHATFAWLCDVYVDPDARGLGVGTALVSAVDVALSDLGVGRAVLATGDAHGLYAKFGFEPMTQPERWMLRTYLP